MSVLQIKKDVYTLYIRADIPVLMLFLHHHDVCPCQYSCDVIALRCLYETIF